jgi:hypothetical protein
MKTSSAVAILGFATFITALAGAGSVRAGCLQDFNDRGDAPECRPAYPSGVIGRFPSCSQGCGSGTQEISTLCSPRSSPPGTPGAVLHINNYDAWQLWLGCHGDGFTQIAGADDEFDCGARVDCTATAWGMSFDQDECFGDGSDAGLLSEPLFKACRPATVTFSVVRCVAEHVYLNVLLDMNADGDWNDSFTCDPESGTCAFEWAIKNYELSYPQLCRTYTSPAFMVGPYVGPGWMRITVSTNPAADSFPWDGKSLFNGTAVAQFYGGETEDYPATIELPTPVARASWGRVKTLYR